MMLQFNLQKIHLKTDGFTPNLPKLCPSAQSQFYLQNQNQIPPIGQGPIQSGNTAHYSDLNRRRHIRGGTYFPFSNQTTAGLSVTNEKLL